ncbi:MAG: TlpA family protein disulfide reductase, partial [Muribaculaceae bacterium]|nr:TlpA family protein disulfide reductase [Muribaculaceae bacterium]
LTTPKLRHKDLLFDNPLLLCLGGILLKLWEDSKLFYPAKLAAGGFVETSESGKFYGTDNFSDQFDILYDHLESTGVGNCFAVQLVQSKSYIDYLHTPTGPISIQLERNSRILPYITKNNTSDMLNTIVMKEYNDFVKDIAKEENGQNSETVRAIVIEESNHRDILENIIAPYLGNVLYLDFWGMSCGPCREGMIRQKPILEEMANQPLKVLYIASLEDGIETCKTWLKKQNIKGEHIFVSANDWKRLSQQFNFNKIPFGVLIGKDGHIIMTNYHTYSIDDPIILNALKE